MDILLGIFDTPAYREMYSRNSWSKYPFISIFGCKIAYNTIIDIVEEAVIRCNKVHFVLNGINLPIDIIHSATCQELSLIINNPLYIEKTIFYYNNKIVNKDQVLALIHQSVTDEGTPIKFSSLIK